MDCQSGIASDTLAKSAGYKVGYKWGEWLVCCHKAVEGGCSKAAEHGELRQELTSLPAGQMISVGVNSAGVRRQKHWN